MLLVKYLTEHSGAEQKVLHDTVVKSKAPARKILRTNILLASGRNAKQHMTVTQIARVCHTTTTTVQNIRTSCAYKDLEATIYRKKRETPSVPAKVIGDVEAHIIALSCSAPPKGYERWTVRLLAYKYVELN